MNFHTMRACINASAQVLVHCVLVVSAIVALLFGHSAYGGTFYWDTNSTTAGSGAATGTWGTSLFWTTDPTGSSATANTTITNGDDVFFSAGTTGTTGTVTVNLTQAASSITFDDNVPITISGGTSLTIGGTGASQGIFATSAVTTAANVVSTPVILLASSTAQSVSNAGGGSLTVGAITGAATTGTQTITVGASSTGNITLNGIIGNGGGGGKVALNISSGGTGTTTLSGVNTFTGGITLTAGKTAITVNTNLGAAGIALNGGTLSTAETAQLTFGAAQIITVGAGGGTIDNTVAQKLLIGTAGGLTGSGTLTRNASANNTLANVFQISVANTGFTGGVVLNGGVTEVSLNGLGNGLTGSNTITVNTNGELVASNSILPNALIVNGGIIGGDQGNATFSGTVNAAGTFKVRLGDFFQATNRNLTISGNLSGSGVITLIGNQAVTVGAGQTLFLNGSNGGYSANVGVPVGYSVSFGAASSFGTGTVTVNSDATALGGIGVGYDFGATLPTFTNTKTSTGGVFGVNTTLASTTTLNLATLGGGGMFLGSQTTGTYAATTLGTDSNVYRLGGGGGTITLPNNTLSGANSLVVGDARINGGGTVVLGGANTFTGAININNGFVQVASIGSVNATSSNLGAQTTATNATLNLGSTTATGGLIYTGAGESTDRVINMTGTTGGASITQSGTGNLLFTSSPTFTGAGAKSLTLQGSTAGTGQISATIAGGITGSTSPLTIAKAGTGTWTLSGGNNTATQLSLAGGILDTGANGITLNDGGSTIIAATANSTLNGKIILGANGGDAGAAAGITLTLNAPISGVNGIDYFNAGIGTTIVTGANTYTGATNIQGQIVSVTSIGSVGSASSNLGAPANATNGTIALGSTTTAGTLTYTGTGETTDRVINLAGTTGGGGISQSGTGLLKFTSDLSVTGVGAKTLTLQGSTAGTGEFAGVIKDSTGGATGVTKSGTGNWTLSKANTYTGATTLAGGTLIFSLDKTTTVGPLVFGASLGGATNGNLDLTTANATFSTLTVQNNSSTANIITLGSGKTLTFNGATLNVGYVEGTAANVDVSKLTIAGATNGVGTLVVNNAAAVVQVGVAASVQLGTATANTLDVTTLASVAIGTIASPITTLNVGFGQTAGGTLNLSNTANTVAATTINIGHSNGLNGGNGLILLGTGTNAINADTINIGFAKVSGTLDFTSQTAGSIGTVTIGNKAGTGAASISVGNVNLTATAGGATGVLDLRGHVATVNASTLLIGNGDSTSNISTATGTVSFDTGTFTVGTLNVAQKVGASTGATTGTLNIGGGTFTVNTSVNFGSQATGGSATANLNLSGGTLISNVDFAVGTASATTNITLTGGIFDLTGKNLGSAAAPVDTLSLQTGTLKNVSSINGTGGITKSTAGTFNLAGTNNFTGATTVTSGTLALQGAPTASQAVGGSAISVNGATLSVLSNVLVGDSTATAGPTQGTIAVAGTTAATLSMVDGAINTLNIRGNATPGATTFLTLGGAATAATLNFEAGNAGVDSITLTPTVSGSGTALLNAGGAIVNITGLAGETPASGTYNLISYSAGSTLTGVYTLGSFNVPGKFAALNSTSTVLQLVVAPSAGATNVFWTGSQSSTWSTFSPSSNFVTTQSGSTDSGLPDTTTNVFFAATSASNLSNTLGQNASINSLSFTSTGTAASSSFTIGGANSLTINAAAGFTDQASNSYAAGIGLVAQLGTAAHTINAPVVLGNSQTWQIDSAAGLTVSGAISGTGMSLTKAGAGTLLLTDANTFGGNAVVNAGTLALGVGSTVLTAPVVFGSGSTGVLQINTATQTITGLTSVDTSDNNAFVQNNAGTSSVLTVNQTVNGSFGGILRNNPTSSSLGLTKGGAGTLTLNNVNSYTGGTIVALGTLQLNVDNALASTLSVSFSGTTGSRTLDIGSHPQTIGKLDATDSTGNVIIGNSTLTVSGASDFSVTGVATSTLDMSGLTTFKYTPPTTAGRAFRFGQNNINSNANPNILTFANDNTINAATIAFGDTYTAGSATIQTTLVHLGQTNVFNGDTITVGGLKNLVTTDFRSGLIAPSLTIRNAAGTGRTTSLNIAVNEASTQTDAISTLDLLATPGSLDAMVNTLTIAQYNATAAGQTRVATGTLKMGAGTLDATTIVVGQALGTFVSTGPVTGTLQLGSSTVAGGTITAGTLTLADRVNPNNGMTSNVTLNSGTLNATTIKRGANDGTINFNWVDGTIGNVATADQTVNGVTAVSALTGGLNIVLNNTGNVSGTHTWNVTSGRTATIQSTAILSGAGGLTKTGPGALVLSGTNTFNGATIINGGTLKLGATGSIASTPTISIATGSSYDVSSVASYTLSNGQTLTGTGSVLGDLAVGGGIVAPGTVGTVGALTLGSSITFSAGSAFGVDIGGTTADRLTVTGPATLGGAINFNALSGLTASSYTLLSYTGTLSGTFTTVTNLPSGYTINYGTGTNSVVSLVSAGAPAAATVTITLPVAGKRYLVNSVNVGAVTGTVGNAVSATNNLAVSLSNGPASTQAISNFTPVASSVAPGGSTNFTGDITASSTAGSYTLQVRNTDGSASPTTADSATVAINVVNQRTFTGPGTINLGNIHVGAVISQNALIATSGSHASTSDATLLTYSGSSINGLTVTGGPDAIDGSSSSNNINRTISGIVTGSGAISGTFTLAANDELAGSVSSSATIGISGNVYSGNGAFTGSGSGNNWADFSKWDAGGAPGLDANFKSVDIATFSGASATINLSSADGSSPVSPSINTLNFSNPASSFVVAPGAAGSPTATLHFNGGAGAATLKSTGGTQLISAPVSLDTNLNADITGTTQLSGAISQSGGARSLTKTGSGTLDISGAASYTGGTRVSGGSIKVEATGSLANNRSYNPTTNPGGVQVDAVPTASYTQNMTSAQKMTWIINAAKSLADYGSSVGTGTGSSTFQTQADIRAGMTSQTISVNMQWRQRASNDPLGPPAPLASDVLNLTGMGIAATQSDGRTRTDSYVLQMSYDPSVITAAYGLTEVQAAQQSLIKLGYLSLGSDGDFGGTGSASDMWTLATNGDFGSGSTVVSNYQGSWDTFIAANNPTFNSATDSVASYLGSYGVDTTNHTVWAVINHNSEFAVVPEPSTLVLLSFGLAGLAGIAYRRGKKLAK